MKILFIILICLEKGRNFWKSQGKIREFHQEEKVGTMTCERNISYTSGFKGFQMEEHNSILL